MGSDLVLGILALGFGLTTLVLRQVKPEVFHKLGPMKERWGDAAGTAIHVVGYSVIPIVAGIVWLMAGLGGG